MDYFALYSQLSQTSAGACRGTPCPKCYRLFPNGHEWLAHRREAHALHILPNDEAEFTILVHANEKLIRPAAKPVVVEACVKDVLLSEEQIPQDTRRTSAATTTKRTQIHPSNFQCDLCPKRFTRAFALKNHIRTHTDERPFACTVCGKAFSRQHDRKMHEALHSGEKNWMCKGRLPDGRVWGCGKRFSRATHLDRHLRSEKAQACVRSFADDEAQNQRFATPPVAVNRNGGTSFSKLPSDSSTAKLPQQEQQQSGYASPHPPLNLDDEASSRSPSPQLVSSPHPQPPLPVLTFTSNQSSRSQSPTSSASTARQSAYSQDSLYQPLNSLSFNNTSSPKLLCEAELYPPFQRAASLSQQDSEQPVLTTISTACSRSSSQPDLQRQQFRSTSESMMQQASTPHIPLTVRTSTTTAHKAPSTDVDEVMLSPVCSQPSDLVDDLPPLGSAACSSKNEKKYRCSFGGCNKTFFEPIHFMVHLRNHNSDDSYQCLYCGNFFLSPLDACKHEREHLAEERHRQQSSDPRSYGQVDSCSDESIKSPPLAPPLSPHTTKRQPSVASATEPQPAQPSLTKLFDLWELMLDGHHGF